MRNIILALCLACFTLSMSGRANLTSADKPLAQWTPDVGKRVTRRIADRLISAAREVLRESPDFKAFLERNHGNEQLAYRFLA